MKYIYVHASNGFCGCDEDFLMTVPKETSDSEIFNEILQCYSYADGAAGMEPDDEFFEEYSYEAHIADYTEWDEVTKEEYERLKDEENIEER